MRWTHESAGEVAAVGTFPDFGCEVCAGYVAEPIETMRRTPGGQWTAVARWIHDGCLQKLKSGEAEKGGEDGVVS
jgi:hypothetical protein